MDQETRALRTQHADAVGCAHHRDMRVRMGQGCNSDGKAAETLECMMVPTHARSLLVPCKMKHK
eukprot:3738894-Lingulodinium_polyedra.AAC.1